MEKNKFGFRRKKSHYMRMEEGNYFVEFPVIPLVTIRHKCAR
jgi:hypothetical protein